MSMRILHVTEVMQGGVADFLVSITSRQLEESAKVYVIYPKLKQPIQAREFLDQSKKNTASHINQANFPPFITVQRFLLMIALLIRLRWFLMKSHFDIIHLHSSFAGLARFPGLISKKKSSIVFSPHGLSFLQSNHSSIMSQAFLTVEKYLARRENLFICTSASEAQLVSDQLVPKNKVMLVANGIANETIRKNPKAFPEGRFRIAMIGRITYQKAPWVFNEIAAVCSHLADFKWIGAEPGVPIKWLDGRNIEILPWLNREELIEQLESVDLVVHPTLWEGFPLSVALAQGRGIPALVSNVIGNRDAISHEFSGFVCDSFSDYETRIKQIIGSESLYNFLSIGSVRHAREFLSDRNIGRTTLHLYQQYLSLK